jgi:hypothetical protein
MLAGDPVAEIVKLKVLLAVSPALSVTFTPKVYAPAVSVFH